MISKRNIFGVLAVSFKIFAEGLNYWPLVIVAALYISPAGPHIRWEYQYRNVYDQRVYTSCTYLGSKGFVTPPYTGQCPLIKWIDVRKHQ